MRSNPAKHPPTIAKICNLLQHTNDTYWNSRHCIQIKQQKWCTASNLICIWYFATMTESLRHVYNMVQSWHLLRPVIATVLNWSTYLSSSLKLFVISLVLSHRQFFTISCLNQCVESYWFHPSVICCVFDFKISKMLMCLRSHTLWLATATPLSLGKCLYLRIYVYTPSHWPQLSADSMYSNTHNYMKYTVSPRQVAAAVAVQTWGLLCEHRILPTWHRLAMIHLRWPPAAQQVLSQGSVPHMWTT